MTLRQKTRLSRKADTWRHTSDTEGRLTSVVTPDGTRWRYRYDPLGRRTAKQRLAADGETTVEEVLFTWDGAALCEQTTASQDMPHPVALTWDHRGLAPLAQTERILTPDARREEIDRRFLAIATDLIGTPTELVDENGDIAWRTRTTPWGTTAWTNAGTTCTPLRFPGQYHDLETGLHYNVFRHYDPATARYLTTDPLGLETRSQSDGICGQPTPVRTGKPRMTLVRPSLEATRRHRPERAAVPASRSVTSHQIERRLSVKTAGFPSCREKGRPLGHPDTALGRRVGWRSRSCDALHVLYFGKQVGHTRTHLSNLEPQVIAPL